jgi:hypothetical protein
VQVPSKQPTSKADLALQKLQKDADALWVDLQACDLTDESLPLVRAPCDLLAQHRDHCRSARGPIAHHTLCFRVIAHCIAGSDSFVE